MAYLYTLLSMKVIHENVRTNNSIYLGFGMSIKYFDL